MRYHRFASAFSIAIGIVLSLANPESSFGQWAWGYNAFGELGNGTINNASGPAAISGITGLTIIAGGELHTLAIKSDGTAWAWGSNGRGQLGNTLQLGGSTAIPEQVTGLTNVVALAAGVNHSLGLKNDGTVWAWGDNTWGQLGNTNLATSNAVPVQVSGLVNIVAIAAGQNHSVALRGESIRTESG